MVGLLLFGRHLTQVNLHAGGCSAIHHHLLLHLLLLYLHLHMLNLFLGHMCHLVRVNLHLHHLLHCRVVRVHHHLLLRVSLHLVRSHLLLAIHALHLLRRHLPIHARLLLHLHLLHIGWRLLLIRFHVLLFLILISHLHSLSRRLCLLIGVGCGLSSWRLVRRWRLLIILVHIKNKLINLNYTEVSYKLPIKI